MEALTVFYDRHSELLRELENNTKKGLGYFYIVEFKSNLVKIGCTQHPYSRMEQLAQTLEREVAHPMQRIAISGQCKFFRKHEATMHKAFDKERVPGRELFNISFDEAVKVGKFLIEQVNKDREFLLNGNVKRAADLAAALERNDIVMAMGMAFMAGMEMENALQKAEV